MQRILREREVLRVMGFSHSKMWEDIKKEQFPSPLDLGPRARGWLEDEITGHQDKLKAERDARLAERGDVSDASSELRRGAFAMRSELTVGDSGNSQSVSPGKTHEQKGGVDASTT